MDKIVVPLSVGILLLLVPTLSLVSPRSWHLSSRTCIVDRCLATTGRQVPLFSSSDDMEEETAASAEEGVTDDDTLLMQAVDEDGALPGGLTPDQMMGLVQNPEVIELLKSPKMQDASKYFFFCV